MSLLPESRGGEEEEEVIKNEQKQEVYERLLQHLNKRTKTRGVQAFARTPKTRTKTRGVPSCSSNT